MRLYLIRHAKAERTSSTGLDEDRSLTKRGIRQAAWLGETLRASEPATLRLVASPAVRAQETARVIAEHLGISLDTEPAIGLDAVPQDILEYVATLPPDSNWVLVGHNPTFSRAVDLLTSGPGSPAGTNLRTGEAAALEFDDPSDAIGHARLVAALRIPEAADHG